MLKRMNLEVKCAFDEMMPTDLVPENKHNANKHPERQIEILKKILSYQGWRAPLVISKRSGRLVAGHGRLIAAKQLGLTEVPVNFQDFESEAQEIAHLVADNKIAELADHDDNFMIEGIKELELQDMDFELLGIGNLNITDLDPEPEQGKSEKKLIIMECPHCERSFEKGQAKIVD